MYREFLAICCDHGDPIADWPDYTSSESDADSEIEVVQRTEQSTDGSRLEQSTDRSRLEASTPEPAEEQPVKDNQTASKILHLLSEIGHSNLIDHTVEDHIDHNFLPCKYCKGQVHIV
jgi:hypothetical protein